MTEQIKALEQTGNLYTKIIAICVIIAAILILLAIYVSNKYWLCNTIFILGVCSSIMAMYFMHAKWNNIQGEINAIRSNYVVQLPSECPSLEDGAIDLSGYKPIYDDENQIVSFITM